MRLNFLVKRLETNSPALVLVSAARRMPLSYMMEAIVVPRDSWPGDAASPGEAAGGRSEEGARAKGGGRPRAAGSVSECSIAVWICQAGRSTAPSPRRHLVPPPPRTARPGLGGERGGALARRGRGRRMGRGGKKRSARHSLNPVACCRLASLVPV